MILYNILYRTWVHALVLFKKIKYNMGYTGRYLVFEFIMKKYYIMTKDQDVVL